MPRVFDGSDDRASAGATPVTAPPFTISLWFKPVDATTNGFLAGVSDTAGDNNYFRLRKNSDGTLSAAAFATSAASATTTTTYTAGVWHHACARFTSATSRQVYLNGGGKGTNTTNRSPAGVDSVCVGARVGATASDLVASDIAHVAIWNVALTDQEIAALARGTSPLSIRPQNLVFFAPLDGRASPEIDYTRNGNDLTLTGSPAVAATSPPVAAPWDFAPPSLAPAAVSGAISKDLTPAAETDSAQALDRDKSKALGVAAEASSARPLSYAKPIVKNLTPATETDSAGGYASQILRDSPRAWYRMREASGLIQDSSGNGNHATSSDGSPAYAQTGPISEPADRAILFAADVGFVVPHDATLDLADSLTIEAWVKVSSDTGRFDICVKSHTGGFHFYLADGVLVFEAVGSAPMAVTTISVDPDALWHHVAVTKNGSDIHLYVDGGDFTFADIVGTVVDAASSLAIGPYPDSSYASALDELAIYGSALSEERVVAHYLAGPAAFSLDVDKTRTLALATEADSARPLSIASASKTLGIALEADSAQALDRDKLKTLGVAAEADSARPLDVDKPRTLGVASETDSARPLSVTHVIYRSLTAAAETDQARPLDADKARSLGAASELDSAGALNVDKTRSLGVASESDSARPLDRDKSRTLGVAAESDAARPLDVDKPRTLGIALEADSARPLDRDKTRTLGVAAETDSAQALDRDKARTLGPAGETDTARPLDADKTRTLGVALESDAAVELSIAAASHTLGVASETDSARPLDADKRKTLGVATESDSAGALSYVKVIFRTLGAALETSTGRLLSLAKRMTLSPASESDAAVTLATAKRVVVAPAGETDQARPQDVDKRVTLSVAISTDTARALVYSIVGPGVYLVPATENTAAGALSYARAVAIAPALELDEALELVLSLLAAAPLSGRTTVVALSDASTVDALSGRTSRVGESGVALIRSNSGRTRVRS